MAALQGFMQGFLMVIFAIAIAVSLVGLKPNLGRSASQPQPSAPPVAMGAISALV